MCATPTSLLIYDLRKAMFVQTEAIFDERMLSVELEREKAKALAKEA
jgi:hypothetical protein